MAGLREEYEDTEGIKLVDNASLFPKHGFMVPLDHTFPEKRDQNIRPRLGQLPQLIPLFLRYLY